MDFFNFFMYGNMNKDENPTNTDKKPNSRIWRELKSNNEANWAYLEMKTATDIWNASHDISRLVFIKQNLGGGWVAVQEVGKQAYIFP